MESIISMLNEFHLPGSFWWDALAAFVQVHNRSPTSSLSHLPQLTPYELWYHSKPDVAHFRVFGCTAYVHIKKDKRKQLRSHTQKCVFIGYPTQYKAWLFWNPVTKKEVLSNTAEFDERYFPGLKNWSFVPAYCFVPPTTNTPLVLNPGLDEDELPAPSIPPMLP